MQLIYFHLVFDALNFEASYYDIFEAIEKEILDKFEDLSLKFSFDAPFESELKFALCKLAKNDRKKYALNKFLPRPLIIKIYAAAINSGVVSIEKTLEKPRVKSKYQKAKKLPERDKAQDKVVFNDNFTRFWFYFIEPNLALLKNGEKGALMEIIRREFDSYASFGFELLCRELLAFRLGAQPARVRSLWAKNIEIDIFLSLDGRIIVGEAKFKEHKICKNVVNLLLKKCERLGFVPDAVALFSKSGFSNEVSRLKNDRILLFDLENFEELL